MDNKYFFLPYEGRFDTNIFLKGIFDANLFCAKGGKKRNVSSAWYPFQSYELYFSINTDLVSDVNLEREMSRERVEKQGFRSQQQNQSL